MKEVLFTSYNCMTDYRVLQILYSIFNNQFQENSERYVGEVNFKWKKIQKSFIYSVYTTVKENMLHTTVLLFHVKMQNYTQEQQATYLEGLLPTQWFNNIAETLWKNEQVPSNSAYGKWLPFKETKSPADRQSCGRPRTVPRQLDDFRILLHPVWVYKYNSTLTYKSSRPSV